MGHSYEAVRPGRRRQDSKNRFTLARVHTGPERNATTGEGKRSDRASADARCRLPLEQLGHLGHTNELRETRQCVLTVQFGRRENLRLNERPLRQIGG